MVPYRLRVQPNHRDNLPWGKGASVDAQAEIEIAVETILEELVVGEDQKPFKDHLAQKFDPAMLPQGETVTASQFQEFLFPLDAPAVQTARSRGIPVEVQLRLPRRTRHRRFGTFGHVHDVGPANTLKCPL
jgi:hypothetical protein